MGAPAFHRTPNEWPSIKAGGIEGLSVSGYLLLLEKKEVRLGKIWEPWAQRNTPIPQHPGETQLRLSIHKRLLASGGGKLPQRDHDERQHHAGGQQGGDDDGCDGTGA